MRVFQSRRLRFLFASLFCIWSLLLILRAVFYFGFSGFSQDPMGIEQGQLAKALWIGARFDLRLAIILNVPFFLMAYMPRWNLVNSKVMRSLACAWLVLSLGTVLLFYIFDFGHYAYLGIRVDSTALRFFEDTGISAQMVWQSYPVLKIAMVWVVLLIIYYSIYRLIIHRLFIASTDPQISRFQTGLAITLLLVIGSWGALGRYSLVPLRWNHAYFSGDPAVAALGLNPVLYFFDTFQFREPPWEPDQVRKYYTDISFYLGLNQDKPDVNAAGPLKPDYARLVLPAEHARFGPQDRSPNIIFIMLESLGASRLGIYGNPLNSSPVLDSIGRNGWLFKNFYVPVSGTSRTVFASITGLPDVSSVETATRNPLISEQHTIINAFTGHSKFYFIGGSAGWANMGALIKRSIPQIQLFQEGDYEAPVVDVWGISDLSLFREADARFKNRSPDQPFFAIIQTAGNHRPFTIPDDNEGFVREEIDEDQLTQWGFRSSDQYNAVRLLDYNIGLFLEMAKKSGYFDNTIFVLYGDHNNRITRTPHMAPFYEALDLDGLHVPHIIYAPFLLEPRVIEEAASLVDVLPTIAGLLGVTYLNTGMGRDINMPFPEDERVVFTQTSGKRFPVIGAVSKNYMLRMNWDESDPKLHDLSSSTPEVDVSAVFPEKAKFMKRLAKGIYETTRYMHHHNSPRSHQEGK